MKSYIRIPGKTLARAGLLFMLFHGVALSQEVKGIFRGTIDALKVPEIDSINSMRPEDTPVIRIGDLMMIQGKTFLSDPAQNTVVIGKLHLNPTTPPPANEVIAEFGVSTATSTQIEATVPGNLVQGQYTLWLRSGSFYSKPVMVLLEPRAVMKVRIPEEIEAVEKTTKMRQAEALKSFRPTAFPKAVESQVGLAAVRTDKQTGEIWAILMYTGWENGWTTSNALAGLYSDGLKNTGTTTWRGVTISAKVEVLSLQGSATIQLYVLEGGAQKCTGTQQVTSPGTYEVNSPLFDMEAMAEYQGQALLKLKWGGKNEAVGCYAKIASIKFNFP